MNSFIKTSLQTGIPFGILMGIIITFFSVPAYGLPTGIAVGIISGIASGIVLGLLATFVSMQAKKITQNRPRAMGKLKNLLLAVQQIGLKF